MAKIRMLTGLAGEDFAWAPGEVVEADDELARALCSADGGAPRARPVDDDEPTSAELRAVEAERQAAAAAADAEAVAAVEAERQAAGDDEPTSAEPEKEEPVAGKRRRR